MENKYCPKCRVVKLISDFHRNKARADGLASYCKICMKDFKHGTYLKYKDSYLKQSALRYSKNRDRLLQLRKLRHARNKESDNIQNAEYYARNREKILSRMQEKYKDGGLEKIKSRYENDIQYRLSNNLRSRLRLALKNNQKLGSAVLDLGCSVGELKEYLEGKFQPEMSWNNYGDWHIDHVLPLSSFDLTNEEEFKKACHYTNLQPLWAEDNLKKGASI